MNNATRNWLLCLLLVGMLPISAPGASQGSVKSMTVGQRLERLEKDLSRLQRLIDNRALLELVQRVDDLSQEVSELRGLMEQQSHDLAGLKKRQRELYLDIDRRLRDLESTTSRTPVAASALPATPSADRTMPATPAVGKSRGKTPPRPVIPEVRVPAGQATTSEERASYQKAFDLLKEGRYARANAAFRDFLKKHPLSSYAGNAQYWLGESLYVSRRFKEAAEEFQRVLKKYPGSNKAPDAMLKLGYTWYELKQYDSARTLLQQLLEMYPKSTAARLAAKRLERMKREGI